MTEKQLFFTKLSGKLAKELKISPMVVGTIRSFVLGYGKTLEEVYAWAETKISQPKYHKRPTNDHSKKKRRKRSKAYYQEVLDFLDTVKKDQWELLIQKTEFDKPK